MPFDRLQLLLALAVAAILYGAHLATRQLAPTNPDIGVRIDGDFPRDGQYAGDPLTHGRTLRFWGSWAGSDENTGRLTLGPFPAPGVLHFAAGGYPDNAGNRIYVERADTGERRLIPIAAIGERWRVIGYPLPGEWLDQPLLLVADDQSKALGGWLGLSEPLRGGRATGSNGFIESVAAWAINGLLLVLLWQAALAWLARRAWVEPCWLPLLAGAAVAAGGYLAFWIYFATAIAGKVFVVGLLVAGFVSAWRRRVPDSISPDVVQVTRLLLVVGLFHLALLHLYPSSSDYHEITANRYREDMPGDNTLPYNLARVLFEGESPRVPGANWQTSDRPPLQTCWQLLTWPIGVALGFDMRGFGGTAATWFELLWVAAAYGLLRTLRLPPVRAAAWVAVMALTGFFLQHTTFTWPKLSSAALACGAFALWVLPSGGSRHRSDFLLGTVLAALAWLAHGGVAFSYLALTPWLIWRVFRGEGREWLLAGALFLVVVAPWIGYQKLYEPPANLLLKWHLGGQIERDERGTWETIRDGYGALTGREIANNKLANFRIQVRGNWQALVDTSFAGASDRRADEFFHPSRALTWWLLGLPLLGITLLRRSGRKRLAPTWRGAAALALWIAATDVVWCLLMFLPSQAVIHQGSLALMLALFVLLSFWIEQAGRWWLAVVAVLQTATMVSTYAVPNAIISGPPVGLPFVIVTGMALAGIILAGIRRFGSETASG